MREKEEDRNADIERTTTTIKDAANLDRNRVALGQSKLEKDRTLAFLVNANL